MSEKFEKLLSNFTWAKYYVKKDEVTDAAYADLIAYVENLETENARMKSELEAVIYAAYMPEDYKFGLPSYIHQVLYAHFVQFPRDWIEKLEKQRNDLQTDNARLREAVRWRNYPEEIPSAEAPDYATYENEEEWQEDCFCEIIVDRVASYNKATYDHNEAYWFVMRDRKRFPVKVTKWMPLPEPPEAE